MGIRQKMIETALKTALKSKGTLKWLVVTLVAALAATNPALVGLLAEIAELVLGAVQEPPGSNL